MWLRLFCRVSRWRSPFAEVGVSLLPSPCWGSERQWRSVKLCLSWVLPSFISVWFHPPSLLAFCTSLSSRPPFIGFALYWFTWTVFFVAAEWQDSVVCHAYTTKALIPNRLKLSRPKHDFFVVCGVFFCLRRFCNGVLCYGFGDDVVNDILIHHLLSIRFCRLIVFWYEIKRILFIPVKRI